MIDCFGRNASQLRLKKLWLLDMDGTIYNDNVLFDGALEFLHSIKTNGGRYVFITNNSSKSVKDYIGRLRGLNIEVDENNFFTSSQASIIMLNEKYRGKKVYCQGTKSLVKELREGNVNVTEFIEDDVDVVLVGFDTELTSEKICRTCEMLQKDVDYYATNPDLVCPVKFGYIPDCGSICDMLKNATGKIPVYIGKPQPEMINMVMKKFARSAEETVVVGDRLYTDIAAGNNASVDSVCVLTGEATIESIKKSDIKPAFIFDSVKDILNFMIK